MKKYKPINGWTKKTIIEHIERNIKGKSHNKKTGQCFYRNPDGKACAVGIFIPDDIYTPELDSINTDNTVKGILGRFSGLLDYMPLEQEILSQLQLIHDSNVIEEKTIKDRLIKFVKENVI